MSTSQTNENTLLNQENCSLKHLIEELNDKNDILKELNAELKLNMLLRRTMKKEHCQHNGAKYNIC